MKQIPLAIALDSPRSFDNFMPGANAMALEQLRHWSPGAAPVYLWGAPGSGKSHLLQALAQQLQQQGAQVAWFSPASPPPWTIDDGQQLALIDDADRLDPAQQHAAFALFVDAATRGVGIVAAGRLPPVDLPLREDLRTRLGWGHVIALQPLAEADVRAVLRHAADQRGLFLSDDVMDYLMTRFERDLSHLMAMLERLDAFAMVHKRAITLPLLRQMLAEERAA